LSALTVKLLSFMEFQTTLWQQPERGTDTLQLFSLYLVLMVVINVKLLIKCKCKAKWKMGLDCISGKKTGHIHRPVQL